MPNTLGHLGVQGVATRVAIRGADARWIGLGCLLPDFPWILCRIARFLPVLDLFQIQLYAIVQASLAFCLILSGALALMSARPRRVFGILAFNSLLHLLLDATEVKWGNGVHLLAPFSWRLLSFGWFWPESLPSLVMTGLGLGFAAWCLLRGVGSRAPVTWGTPAARLAAGGLLLVYLAGPALLRQMPARADTCFMGTLQDRAERPGRYVEFDRARIAVGEQGATLRFFSGESLSVTADAPLKTGLASVKARFQDERTLRLLEVHYHPAGLRDAATYLGILLIGLIWLRGAGFEAAAGGPQASKGLASLP